MKIGLDLSSLQGAHRMRGIGYTLLSFINNLPLNNEFSFVFYVDPLANSIDPLELLRLEGVSYEVRSLKPKRQLKRRLPGKLGIITGLVNSTFGLWDQHFGDSRLTSIADIDFFLQTDQSQPLPKRRINSGLILYDIIPFVLKWDYLWDYTAARQHGRTRKGALRVTMHRKLYAYKLRINAKRADKLLAISEVTKNDFVKHLDIKPRKIEVISLGVNHPTASNADITLQQYTETSWGYIPRRLDLSNTAYLLFVGGADSRRKLEDLITGFNHLRAEGNDIKLVLAGDSMQGANNISTKSTRKALQTSSYQDDIIFVGFTDDPTRDWLYEHALAFVFPSKYEGFGLPVLEAMVHNCPVISYPNAATKEVAKEAPLYATNSEEIRDQVVKLLSMSSQKREFLKKSNKQIAEQYDWKNTSEQILRTISD
jgi:glycosyltransferase involved in cell wall biosynthesis